MSFLGGVAGAATLGWVQSGGNKPGRKSWPWNNGLARSGQFPVCGS